MDWKQAVAEHSHPAIGSSVWQLCDSIGPYLALWGLMAWSSQFSYWITLALAVPAAGFLVRIFIIFHDCGHGSFFTSRRANDVWGTVTGFLTFTPYFMWRHEHAQHHATSGDLDRRGIGDVWTMTVDEYLSAGRWKRLCYRMVRNPIVLFVFGPIYIFLIENRIPGRTGGRRERTSVYLTDIALVAIAVGMSFIVGFKAFLLIQLPIVVVGGAAGVWLFYVQHQFEGVCWERGEGWSYVDAAIHGSSFYKLPKVLQWFSGNIGFHHIHHLSPAIPNYNLEKCHEATPMLQEVKAVTLLLSFRSATYRLWDEQRRELIGYRRLHAIRRERGTAEQ